MPKLLILIHIRPLFSVHEFIQFVSLKYIKTSYNSVICFGPSVTSTTVFPSSSMTGNTPADLVTLLVLVIFFLPKKLQRKKNPTKTFLREAKLARDVYLEHYA